MSLDPELLRKLEQCESEKLPVYYVPGNDVPGGYLEGHGYVVAIVVAGEDGYHWTGDIPYQGKQGQKAPLVWGHDLAKARKMAEGQNRKLGLTPEVASLLIARSMARGTQLRGTRKRVGPAGVIRKHLRLFLGGRR